MKKRRKEKKFQQNREKEKKKDILLDMVRTQIILIHEEIDIPCILRKEV
jgi:hypothetical protein